MEDHALTKGREQPLIESQLGPVLSFAAYNTLLFGLLLFSTFNGFDLLVVIYLELGVIGLFALLRLGIAVLIGTPLGSGFSRGATILLGMLLAGFFIAKFGGLMLLLGLVLVSLPSDDLGQGWADAAELHPFVELCVWVLLIRYAIDFFWFTIVKGDYRETSVIRLLLAPYINGLWVAITLGLGVYLAYRYPDSPILYSTLGVFAAKLLLDLINLLLELRRVRLAPVIEARRKRRAARATKASLWIRRALVTTVAVGIVGFIISAVHTLRLQLLLESDLEARGIVVPGTVESKEVSSGSSASYSVRVSYTFEQSSFSNPYWIRRSRWESLEVGDPVDVTVLPEEPRLSQLTEYVGASINGRGFISLKKRIESESPNR